MSGRALRASEGYLVFSDHAVRRWPTGRFPRRRWALLAVYALVGGLLGVCASLLFSPGYTSHGSVLLQGPLAADELRTQALVATSSVVLDRTARQLDGVGVERLRESAEAEVLDGNVIEIGSSGPSPERAQRRTRLLTQEYVGYSRELVDRARGDMRQLLEGLRGTLTDINARIDDALGSPDADAGAGSALARLRDTLSETLVTLRDVGGDEGGAAFGKASVVVLEPAELPAAAAPPTMPQLAGGGAVLFAVLGAVGHVLVDRTRRKPHTDADIAAALGSPVLGSVDIAVAEPRSDDGGRPGRVLRTLARLWPANGAQAGSERDRTVRFRRVLDRLRDGHTAGLRVLVVVARGDETAVRAVAALAAAGGTGRDPTVVLTEEPGLATRIREVADAADPRAIVASAAAPEPVGRRTVLHVVHVDPARPTVPDSPRARGAVVVLTAGSVHSWELVGITEACTDAEHEVLGAMVVHPARSHATDHGRGPGEPASGHASQGRNGSVEADTQRISTNGTAKAAGT